MTPGKATLVGGIAGKQETCERALSTTRKYLAAITCVHTPAKFWARIGEGELDPILHVTVIVCFLQPSR